MSPLWMPIDAVPHFSAVFPAARCGTAPAHRDEIDCRRFWRSPFMRLRSLLLGFVALALAPSTAVGGPLLVSVSRNSWTFQQADGSSHTVVFGENTRYTLCFPRSVSGGFSDGTSNTLLLGENTGIRLRWTIRAGGIADGTSNTILFSETAPLECFEGTERPDPLIDDINDGTSNTIVFGEDPFDLGGDGFDACFTDPQLSTITDGTSNTIVFGENRCFSDVRVAPGITVQAPAPPAAAMLGLSALAWAIRRRVRV
jgi:hypothetical protein